MVEVSFNPSLFLKNEDDIEQCKDILKDWFHKIKICHIQNLSASWSDAKTGNTYPEVSNIAFMHSITSVQDNDLEKGLMSKGKIEVSYIRATRNDASNKLGGTLCRGEYLELLLRLASQRFLAPKLLGPVLEKFLELYIKPFYEASDIIPTRKMI